MNCIKKMVVLVVLITLTAIVSMVLSSKFITAQSQEILFNLTVDNSCNILIGLYSEKTVFFNESIVFYNTLSNKSYEFNITYWIEDSEGNIVKKPLTTKNLAQKSWSPSKKYFEKNGSYIIKNELSFISCNNSNYINKSELLIVLMPSNSTLATLPDNENETSPDKDNETVLNEKKELTEPHSGIADYEADGDNAIKKSPVSESNINENRIRGEQQPKGNMISGAVIYLSANAKLKTISYCLVLAVFAIILVMVVIKKIQ